MTQEMKYENWFLIHSGMKKAVNPTKGGFLSVMTAGLTKITEEIKKDQKTKPKPKEKKKVKEGKTPYEKWFYKNCDNNNEPDLSEINSHDYPKWFEKHCIKKAPEPKYSSQYEAWFFRNCDNRNLPTISKADAHDYSTWFEKHSTKRAQFDNDKSYKAWFERNCDSKNPGVMPSPVLTYELWFDKHCTPPTPVKCESVKHEPYDEWFKRHANK